MAKKKTTEATGNPFDVFYDALGENHCNQGVDEYLSTGIMQLNYALSGRYLDGGFGVGRIHELYGGESSGKTMIATMTMAEAQRKGGIAMFLDYEHSFHMGRAQSLGLLDSHGQWIYKQPETAEQGFEMIEKTANLMVDRFPDTHICVVVDSVAAMKTEAEMEAGFESNMKTKLSLASCMSASLKHLTNMVSSCKMTLLFLNQTRTNPNATYGDPTRVAGGDALKFYASTRTKLSKVGKLVAAKGADPHGDNIKAITIKNKIFMPHRTAEYKTNYAVGVDLLASHFDELDRLGKVGSDKLINRAGAWYTFGDQKVQGFDKFASLIVETPGAYEQMLGMFGEAA